MLNIGFEKCYGQKLTFIRTKQKQKTITTEPSDMTIKLHILCEWKIGVKIVKLEIWKQTAGHGVTKIYSQVFSTT